MNEFYPLIIGDGTFYRRALPNWLFHETTFTFMIDIISSMHQGLIASLYDQRTTELTEHKQLSINLLLLAAILHLSNSGK